MSYRILTKNGVDNTNIDGARAEFFNSGMRDGIVRGAFTEGTFSSNASNSIYLDSCELRISGHRVVIDEPVYKTFSNIPASNTRYSMVAQVSVDSVSVVTFSIIIQDANTELRKDNLYATETGTGIYQIEIGRFTLTTTGTIIDIVRTADLITGGGEDENTYIEIGEVTTTTLDEGIDAEVDVENVIDEQTGKKKTNFHFGIPSASGTVVNINGQHQETVNFDSEPQIQIDELKSTNSTQGKDIDDLKNETLKKPASAPGKRKVVGISTNNSQELIDIDDALSDTSENPVQNKVVKKALDNKQDKLTVGNGIHIEKGVISGLKSEIVLEGQYFYGSNIVEQIMDIDLSKYKFVEFITTIKQSMFMDLTQGTTDCSFHIIAEQYYSGSWHGGIKCQVSYYLNPKQLTWSGNYCGLLGIKGWW